MVFDYLVMQEILEAKLKEYQSQYLERIEMLIARKSYEFTQTDDEVLLMRIENEINSLFRVRNSIQVLERFRFTEKDILEDFITGLEVGKKLNEILFDCRRILTTVTWLEENP